MSTRADHSGRQDTAGTEGDQSFPRVATSPLETWREYLRRGHLAYPFSLEAQRAFFFPRIACPFTGSERIEWRVSEGLGTVYATTWIQPRDGEAYNVALVDVDEGFRMMSRIEGIPPEAVSIGMRVRVRVLAPEGGEAPYPVFVPLERSR